MRAKPYLQLIRLPNLFTAAADSLAGWLLATGTLQHPGRWGCLVGASVSLYAGGVVLNDLCDLAVDRAERPGRPLPSGRVPRAFAVGLVPALFGVGVGLAAWSGTPHGLTVALLICLAVVGYDALLKGTGLGPWAMGLCRSLNLLLGLSVAADLGGPTGWISGASYGTFVAGITWISRNEASASRRFDPGVALGVALQNLAIGGQGVAGALARLPGRPLIASAVFAGAAVLVGIGLVVNRAGRRALREPAPASLQAAVRAGIFSLVWLHVALLLAAHGPIPALAVALLWPPAVLAGRWLYAT